jgi:hypothetical protein
MPEDLKPIYAARTSQEAHLLKNLLEERGIRAVVTNDVLERGAGVDILGWPTLARVVVGEEDAPAARQIAEEFDRQMSDSRAAASAEPAEAAEPTAEDDWPACPRCSARRTTMCPVCQTSGTDFPMADPEYLGTPAAGEAAEAVSCGCGSGTCGRGGAAEEAPAEPEAPLEPPEEPPSLMRMCPTCDEPFVPDYPRRCEWCGHEFPDGYDVDEHAARPGERISARAIVILVGLVLLGAAAVVYFALLF